MSKTEADISLKFRKNNNITSYSNRNNNKNNNCNNKTNIESYNRIVANNRKTLARTKYQLELITINNINRNETRCIRNKNNNNGDQ